MPLLGYDRVNARPTLS